MDSIDDVDALRFSIKTDKEIEKYLGDYDENYIQGEKDCISYNKLIEEIKEDDFIDRKRSYSQKSFGRIDPGSIRGSIFNMTILSLGSACLSLPKSVGDMSLVMGIIAIIFTALVRGIIA